MKNRPYRTLWASTTSRLGMVGLLTVLVLLFTGCGLTGEAGGRTEGTKNLAEVSREARPAPGAGKKPVTPARERELKLRTLVSPDAKAGEMDRESVRHAPATLGAKTGKELAILTPGPGGAEGSLPDLTVDLSLPSSMTAGDTAGASINVVANNIGSADAPGKRPPGTAATGYGIDLYISPTASAPPSRPVYSASYSDYVLLRGGRVSGTSTLAPGTSTDYSTNIGSSAIPGDTLLGEYYICAWIDAGQLVPEEDETNNVNCQPITISSSVPTGAFDITVSSNCAVVSPSYDGYSQSVAISLERRDGHSSPVSFSSWADSGVAGTFSPASLFGSIDGTTVLAITVDSSLSAGTYTVTVEATDGITTHSEAIDLTILGSTAGSGLSFAMSTLSAGGTDTYGFTLSVKSDGSVQSWGSNGFGELGNNDIGINSDVAVDVLGPDGSTSLQNIVAVATGRTHALALREDGTVWSWGQANSGQLGIGRFGFSGVDRAGYPIGYVPFAVPVCGLTDIVAIATGDSHSLALNNVGQVYSFGNNTWGQVGDGSTDDKIMPVEVMETATDVFGDTSIIAAGHFHSLAVDTSGNAYAWGRNEYGPLGNLDLGVDSAYPVAVVDESGSPISNIVDIDGGYAHSLALDSSGVVYGWGDNYWGQLADTSMDTSAPHSDQARDYSDEVTALSAYTVTDIEAGADNSLVIISGAMLGFGWGALGQNGDGNAAERDYTPIASVFPSSTVDPVSVSALGSHVAVLSQNSSGSDGTVYVYGDDREGQLGIGGASDSCTLGTGVVTCEKTPVMVSAATQVMLP